MKNNKGITLVSLVIYIAVVMVVAAAVIRITTYFKNNMTDVADVSFEKEFQKINLYLLEESKTTGNGIDEITGGTEIIFTNGNKYKYIASDKTIYLNDTIKVCENVESCTFSQKTAENGKNVLSLTITINENTKTVEYVMVGGQQENDEINIDDYLWGGSLVSYYLKAGDYVDYTPTTGTYTVAGGTNGSGYTSNQTFKTEQGDEALKWRVLSIDEETGEIELVSATTAQTGGIYLEAADGYNHGVDILNDLCNTLYSNENGAIARSIKIEDINAKTTYDYKTYTNSTYNFTYGDIKQLKTYGTTKMKYPKLYSQENGFGSANTFNTTGLNASEGLNDGVTDANGVTTYNTVTGYTDGNAEGTDPYITYTYYNYKTNDYLNTKLGINTVTEGLFDVGTRYWVASRSVLMYSSGADFHVFQVDSNGEVRGSDLFYSFVYTNSRGYAVRPVVKLDAVELLDFSVGDGSEENPWGMK